MSETGQKLEYSGAILQIVNGKEALRCWTQGFLHPLLHLVNGGVAVDGTVLLHADAAELVGKGKVMVNERIAGHNSIDEEESVEDVEDPQFTAEVPCVVVDGVPVFSEDAIFEQG